MCLGTLTSTVKSMKQTGNRAEKRLLAAAPYLLFTFLWRATVCWPLLCLQYVAHFVFLRAAVASRRATS
jgi:hypothetical protein